MEKQIQMYPSEEESAIATMTTTTMTTATMTTATMVVMAMRTETQQSASESRRWQQLQGGGMEGWEMRK